MTTFDIFQTKQEPLEIVIHQQHSTDIVAAESSLTINSVFHIKKEIEHDDYESVFKEEDDILHPKDELMEELEKDLLMSEELKKSVFSEKTFQENGFAKVESDFYYSTAFDNATEIKKNVIKSEVSDSNFSENIDEKNTLDSVKLEDSKLGIIEDALKVECQDEDDHSSNVDNKNVLALEEKEIEIQDKVLVVDKSACENIENSGESAGNYRTCKECNIKFKKKRQLDAHILTIHPKNGKLMNKITNLVQECDKCNYKTVYKWNFKMHLLTHGDSAKNKKFHCTMCSYKTIHGSNFKKHVRRHDANDPVENNSESEPQSNHKNEKQEEPDVVNTISYSYSRQKIEVLDEERTLYTCAKCDYKTVDKSNLNRHFRRHHIAGSTEIKKNYTCVICKKSLSSKWVLENHYISLHSNEIEKWEPLINSKIYKCSQCDYMSTRLSEIKSHLEAHQGNKKHHCNICSFGTMRKHNLKKHMRNHAKYSFQCELCKCHFKTKLLLDGHVSGLCPIMHKQSC